jgi:hypothetical protein
VWLDGNRDLLRPGERTRVLVRTDTDAYLAVFHIDTNGDVDSSTPAPTATTGGCAGGARWRSARAATGATSGSAGGSGIGYVFAVALDEPLDLGRRARPVRPPLASWHTRWTVTGDPFYAMDRIVHDIVPEGAWGYESVDHYTYHVGARRYTHPRFACYDGYGDWYYGRAVYYTGCDRVRILLVPARTTMIPATGGGAAGSTTSGTTARSRRARPAPSCVSRSTATRSGRTPASPPHAPRRTIAAPSR